MKCVKNSSEIKNADIKKKRNFITLNDTIQS
jgi:hypothetical protein